MVSWPDNQNKLNHLGHRGMLWHEGYWGREGGGIDLN